MRAISRHRGLRDNKMRVLIISAAFLACASAAPSHFAPLSPYAFPAIQTYAVPAALPTISSGDIQAAAIDAQVKAADFAQASVDKARQLNEQAVENWNTKASVSADVNNEQITDVLWATKDKQWQALDAIRSAQAQIDGAVASNADLLAKSAIGAIPYVAGIPSIPPAVYSGVVAPGVKSIAQVQAADFAQASIDKARQLNEQAVENWNTKAGVSADVKNEQITDVLWATKDKQWQALDAIRSAQAQIDGAVASNADLLAKSAIGAIPYVAGIPSIPPAVYSGVVAPGVKSIAQVQAADFAQASIDKARQLNEQAVENWNTKAGVSADVKNEQITDVLWATKDKQWQALDAIRSAQAQIDGAVASNADLLAKSAIGGFPYVAGISPIPPAVYSGVVAPGVKSIATQSLIQTHAETQNVEGAKSAEQKNIEAGAAVAVDAAAVKTAESSEKLEAEKSVQSVDAAAVAAKSEADKALVALQGSVLAPGLAWAGGFGYPGVAIAPVPLTQPILKYANTVQQYGRVWTPTFVKTVW